MTVKELRIMMEELEKNDENAELHFSVMFEYPESYQKESYQDWFGLSPITLKADDISDWDYPTLSLEFELDEIKIMMRKALSDYINKYEKKK